MRAPEVSIIICTHRRFELVKGAVQSLIDQTAPSDVYEVIVVDNDSVTNPLIKDVVSAASDRIRIRYVHEKKIGLSYARNTGGKEAEAEYLGYLDDDAKVNQRYIDTLVNIIKHDKPDICGGPFEPFYLTPKPKWFLDRYGTGTYGSEPRNLLSNEYLTGLNIIFRRSLLEKLNWFNPLLGMAGDKVWYGEETIIQINARKMNPHLKLYYHPGLFVYHLVPERKMKLSWKIYESFQKGNSMAYFWIPDSEYKKEQRKALCRLFVRLTKMVISVTHDIFARDKTKYPFWQNVVFEKISNDIYSIGTYQRLSMDRLLSRMPDDVITGRQI